MHLQEFTREYTKAFLLKFMLANCMKRAVPIIEESVPMVVNCTDSNLEKYCTMRFGLSGRAKISVGWTKVVEGLKLKEGDICLFTFKDERQLEYRERDRFGAWLRLVIMKLEH
jgi:hypothetical protein